MWKLPSPFNMKNHPQTQEGKRGTTLIDFTRIGTERQSAGLGIGHWTGRPECLRVVHDKGKLSSGMIRRQDTI
jgi:hypothetical protein